MSFSIKNYLAKYNPQSVGDDELVIRCPLCGKEKLTVNTSKRLWHCWVCQEYKTDFSGKRVPVKGAGGIIGLVSLLEGISYSDAIRVVDEDSRIRSSGFSPKLVDKKRLDMVYPEIPYPVGSTMISGNLPYCEKRGITPVDVLEFKLFWCSYGRYANRLMFPVFEENRLVFYQARAMWEPIPGEKYIKSTNPPAMEGVVLGPTDFLFNLDQACHYSRVAVCEGPVDAIHTGRDAVCTFGKRLSNIQVRKLLRAGVQGIDLIWDGPTEKEPEGAIPEMVSAVGMLAGLFDLRVVFLPWGDPGDYTRKEISQFRKKAVSAFQLSKLAML